MAGLFVVALFTSATLLFWVQPMVARMLLPFLGGTPTVWNTCMVFFQAMLLAGYAYAHFLTTRFSLRMQAAIHLVLMLAAFVVLPIGLGGAAQAIEPWEFNPFLWLMGKLFLVVALPFFVLSASAPLLQSWFGRAQQMASPDPYHLYAASNLGSLVGLLGYPAWVEPAFSLQTQSKIWQFAYSILVVLFAASVYLVVRRCRFAGNATASSSATVPKSAKQPLSAPLDWGRRARWILWAFIPTSLMLGVTTYLTTDIASVPLLWVLPLGIYLLTFILVFARRQWAPLKLWVRVLPPLAVVLVFVMLNNADNLAWLQMALHLLFLFVAGMVWHGRLAKDRPPIGQLTEFYFCLSIGGVLGGLFNGLVAPLIFPTVMEYRLIIVLACVLWPASGPLFAGARQFWRSLIFPAAIGLVTILLAVSVPRLEMRLQMNMLLIFGVPAILCYAVSKRPQAFEFALSLAAVLAASGFYAAFHGRTLHVERNFFGTLRYNADPGERFFRLYHGTTVHGMRFIEPDRQDEPLAYYHRSGPCGRAMSAFNARADGTNVAVIGLGAGSMAAYAKPNQRWTFYEINPAVIRLAQDTNYFTFLQHAHCAGLEFKVGDARLRLREAPANSIDLLVCDAFGSDAPPLHLLDCEAMELYLAKLAPRGLVLLHISSRFLNFRPVIGNLAAHFKLESLASIEEELTDDMARDGRLQSTWVVLARNAEDLGALRHDARWERLAADSSKRLWTDDYSNILSVFEW